MAARLRLVGVFEATRTSNPRSPVQLAHAQCMPLHDGFCTNRVLRTGPTGAVRTPQKRTVTVEMPDHSRRVLCDGDVRTGDLRWGYTGTGAHYLSSVMLADILDSHYACPDCIGVIPLSANIIRCRSCSNTGKRPGTIRAKRNLLIKVIRELPETFEQTRFDLLRTMARIQAVRSR
jgi:hypothetical protein